MGDGVSMEKIRNLSLKKTMVLYTILSLIVTFFLSVSIIEIAGSDTGGGLVEVRGSGRVLYRQ